MSRPRSVCLVALAIVLGSGPACGASDDAAPSAPIARASDPVPADPMPPPPPPPAPLALVRLEARRIELAPEQLPTGAHAVEIAVVNDGDAPVEVASWVEVHRHVGASYESFEALELVRLAGDCREIVGVRDAPEHVTVPAHGRLVAPPWLGVRRGVGQCVRCDPAVPAAWRGGGCDLAPAGEYSLTSRLADRTPLETARFTLPAPDPAPPPSALCLAAANGDLAGVVRLARDPAERRCALPVSFAPEGTARSSALMLASMYGHVEIVQHLVEVGFDPLERDPETQRSSFVHAAAGNHVPIVEHYWTSGVRPLADDPHVGTVLWWAAVHDRRDVLEHYVALGADLGRGHYGLTPLAAAEQSDHEELARWLRSHGAPRAATSVRRGRVIP